MSSKEFAMVSTKIASDISQLMKLLKARYKARTESDALRQLLEERAPNELKEAQSIAESYGQWVEDARKEKRQ